MDQPTNMEISIKGEELEVKRAANAAMRRINRDTSTFDEDEYIFGDGSDFEKRMESILDLLGDYELHNIADGKIEFKSEQECYGIVEEDEVKDIANEIVKTSPNVEFYIYTVITITASEGYDICVDIDYDGKEMKVECNKEYYDDYEDDEFDEEE